ncbi:MAG: hypothetical protein A3C06_01840 [Candidatus Taylorbacteria bacterium RIFCSPHIGHO2_02_FULL_46_13]|uniref:Ada DNA repair metal-binding domain-containing protein n=1 Tax=Candidatus Taylorbacteria bacterium RIFCSPHIGHO2_02_FULL_46_13 TaxID=1802312 RepID=A0A1G2MSA7_9BACT|nr:MAG: hypothetical protein A3C06_01840 [Candidatus Taylorbacteria bacterium RIFCSPHIGHO2_02_FULL_46_13]
MSISDNREFIKRLAVTHEKDFFVLIVMILVSLGSFALGRLSALESAPTQTIQEKAIVHEAISANIQSGMFVASKTGTKYYFPWCGVARNIKDGSKVWFVSVEEAKSAGYTPGNCKGLN